MSEAAAAFFAHKKRKKAFKFNANLIDVSVSATGHTSHVEAPALSRNTEASVLPQSGSNSATPGSANAAATVSPALNNVVTDNENDAPNSDARGRSEDNQQWGEAAVVPRTKSAPSSSAPEVLDMKSFAQNKGASNISEKLRVEETKAQLAAAREGMEREAARAKVEKESKEQAAREKEAAKAASSGGGIWVSARMKAAQSTNLPKIRMGTAAKQQQLDTSNEELFPDLASADKILEQKEKAVPVARGPKKTPVGGGASWASKTHTKSIPISSMKSITPADGATESDEKKSTPDELPKIGGGRPDADPASGPEPTPDRVQVKEEAQVKEPEVAPTELVEASSPAEDVPSVKAKKPVKKKKKDTAGFKPCS